MEKEEIIRALPKVEQHIHIIGSIRPETLLWLAENLEYDSPFTDLEEVERYFRYRNFDHFLEVYTTVNDHISDERQFERISYEMIEDEVKSNVRHVECIFSAWDMIRRGLDYGEILDAINRGLRKGLRDFGVSSSIRIDLVRNYGPEIGLEVLKAIEEKCENVVAIDLGGSESGFPASPYKEIYSRANALGLHRVVHAGEAAGPESIWQAIKIGAERIGHGVAAREDSRLIEYLRDKGIPIECCPTSNVRTGSIDSIKNHPIRDFYDRGLIMTVNTDDPSMFNTNMNHEYLELNKHLGFSISELYQISKNALNTSFMETKRQANLIKEFDREYQRLCTR